jgi:hypothetical protein
MNGYVNRTGALVLGLDTEGSVQPTQIPERDATVVAARDQKLRPCRVRLQCRQHTRCLWATPSQFEVSSPQLQSN